MKLYRSQRMEVPEDYYTVPIGKAAVAREGKDVSVITYGYMVTEALKAAEALSKEGIDVEVVDLRTVAPLDIEAIIATTEKTGRVVVVQEAQRTAGVASDVMSEISERAILSLKAPIARVAAPDTVFPFGMAENDWLPNHEDIRAKIKEVYEFN
jgi:pyruvate dehydrogenase E1 component beta subunit